MTSDNAHTKRPFGRFFGRLTAPVNDRVEEQPAESVASPRNEVSAVSTRNEILEEDRNAAASLPWSLRIAAALSWRAIVVAVAAAGLIWLGLQLSMIVIPIAIALLLAVLLEPLVGWMVNRLHLPRTLAAVLGLLLSIFAIIVAFSQAGNEIFQQMPRLIEKASAGIETLMQWIQNGPLALDTTVLDQGWTTIQQEITQWVQSNTSMLASGALSVTSSVVSIFSSTFVVLFCLFFFLKEGRGIWLWVVRLFPSAAREPLHESAIRGWVTLGSYVRTQIQVAAIDALGIGLGAFFLGLPMVLPIVVVVFFASFVPIVGAMISGAIAVFVALVDQGLTAGIIMLIIILVVQQIESNLLQPLLMSNAVALHPVAVLLVVTAAGSVAGIPGAIFGVPIAAFINSAFLYLHGHDSMPNLQTAEDRPGGPPGLLHEMVRATYSSGSAATKSEDEQPEEQREQVATQVTDEIPSEGETETSRSDQPASSVDDEPSQDNGNVAREGTDQ